MGGNRNKDLRRLLIGSLVLILLLLQILPLAVLAVDVTSPSAILMEASTGQVIYEKNADEIRSPASITKIMTLLLVFEHMELGKVSLEDEVITSEYASSMGGSQVFLAQGEVQTLDTMIKCITVASGNDASVAVAEHIAGSEEAFVQLMNEKTKSLGMTNTHFMDCCGLSNSEEHYTTARDVAIVTRELITKYPKIYDYTTIWMEDIIHETNKGSETFGLSSTNKLLKQYPYATGLKTGSTEKAKNCIAATARKDGIDMIAVIMGAPESKTRFSDAQALLAYGFNISELYVDLNLEPLPTIPVKKGKLEEVGLAYEKEYRYLDVEGNRLSDMEKRIELPEVLEAPLKKGQIIGRAVYSLSGREVGCVNILVKEDVEGAGFFDYFRRIFQEFLL